MKNFKRFMVAWTTFWVTAVTLLTFHFVGCFSDDPPDDPEPVDDIIVATEQVVTTSNHFPEDFAAVLVETTGLYEVFVRIELSGDEQKNESIFVQGYDDTGGEIDPDDGNAGPFYVIQDQGGPGQFEVFAGTFDFHEGASWLSIVHYQEIADEYPEFIVDPGFGGAESVHADLFRLVHVP